MPNLKPRIKEHTGESILKFIALNLNLVTIMIENNCISR